MKSFFLLILGAIQVFANQLIISTEDISTSIGTCDSQAMLQALPIIYPLSSKSPETPIQIHCSNAILSIVQSSKMKPETRNLLYYTLSQTYGNSQKKVGKFHVIPKKMRVDLKSEYDVGWIVVEFHYLESISTPNQDIVKNALEKVSLGRLNYTVTLEKQVVSSAVSLPSNNPVKKVLIISTPPGMTGDYPNNASNCQMTRIVGFIGIVLTLCMI